jgi:Selenocysteine lyase
LSLKNLLLITRFTHFKQLIPDYNCAISKNHQHRVISFTITRILPRYISTIVDEQSVTIKAGHHCCPILHDNFNLAATARASVGIYNNKEDIDILCNSIEKCRKVFNLK